MRLVLSPIIFLFLVGAFAACAGESPAESNNSTADATTYAFEGNDGTDGLDSASGTTDGDETPPSNSQPDNTSSDTNSSNAADNDSNDSQAGGDSPGPDDKPGMSPNPGGQGPHGDKPAPCESDSDCDVEGNCLGTTDLGCTCAPLIKDKTFCLPLCETDVDCPQVDGKAVSCSDGICKPEAPGAGPGNDAKPGNGPACETDEQCAEKCPEGAECACVDGQCQKSGGPDVKPGDGPKPGNDAKPGNGPACETDEQCAEKCPKGAECTCVDGQCQKSGGPDVKPGDGPKPGGDNGCSSESDCADKCPAEFSMGCTCAVFGKCVPKCASDSDCPQLNNVLVCDTNDGICVPQNGGPSNPQKVCETDTDCADNCPEGAECSCQDGTCKLAIGAGKEKPNNVCETDGDCADKCPTQFELGCSCAEKIGKCAPNCDSDEDCPQGEKPMMCDLDDGICSPPTPQSKP